MRAVKAISDWHKDSISASEKILSIKTDVPRAENFLQALFGHQEFMSDLLTVWFSHDWLD